MISWFVEPNALSEGAFDIKNIQKNGVSKNQGGHISVLEDYTAWAVDIESGERVYIGEGDKLQHLKDLALNSGEIDSLIIKNSWGDDPATSKTFNRDGEYGYHRLKANYLLTWIEDTSSKKGTLPLLSLVLPKM